MDAAVRPPGVGDAQEPAEVLGGPADPLEVADQVLNALAPSLNPFDRPVNLPNITPSVLRTHRQLEVFVLLVPVVWKKIASPRREMALMIVNGAEHLCAVGEAVAG